MPRDTGTSQPEILTRWACIRSKPRAELWARDNLYRVGFEVYLPMVSVRRRDRGTGRYAMVPMPLFANYLFLAHEPGSPWRGIRGAPGVGKLLLDGYKPQYARVGAVELLLATEDARRNPTAQPSWEPGAACMISQGAFDGHEAVIVEVTNTAARIGLFVFGQLTYATVPVDSLMPREKA
jgi:transcription antitermination factor NusG